MALCMREGSCIGQATHRQGYLNRISYPLSLHVSFVTKSLDPDKLLYRPGLNNIRDRCKESKSAREGKPAVWDSAHESSSVMSYMPKVPDGFVAPLPDEQEIA